MAWLWGTLAGKVRVLPRDLTTCSKAREHDLHEPIGARVQCRRKVRARALAVLRLVVSVALSAAVLVGTNWAGWLSHRHPMNTRRVLFAVCAMPFLSGTGLAGNVASDDELPSVCYGDAASGRPRKREAPSILRRELSRVTASAETLIADGNAAAPRLTASCH
jgi:hypothetical protein